MKTQDVLSLIGMSVVLFYVFKNPSETAKLISSLGSGVSTVTAALQGRS